MELIAKETKEASEDIEEDWMTLASDSKKDEPKKSEQKKDETTTEAESKEESKTDKKPKEETEEKVEVRKKGGKKV